MAPIMDLCRILLLLTCALNVDARAVASPAVPAVSSEDYDIAAAAVVDKRQLPAIPPILPPIGNPISDYDPVRSTCPSSPLVRPATGLSAAESTYINQRKPRAAASLATWLQKVGVPFNRNKLPAVGFTTSGGGYRSLLEGAGVVQAFDSRDTGAATGGVYQALTYHGGLSGGGWLLSSLAGNDWPTVTSLKDGLWEEAFQYSLYVPDGPGVAVAQAQITNDLLAKQLAGFPPTLTDPWGRLLSYQFFYGANGGVQERVSGIANEPQFVARNVPYPIITAIDVDPGQCVPTLDDVQFEIHPYEFGSWDAGVSAFTQTAFVGSDLTNGRPTVAGQCIQNYDNLGYALGTSSSLFNLACVPVPDQNTDNALVANIAPYVTAVHSTSFRDEFAIWPNPFYQYERSPEVNAQKELYLVDGGLSNQNNPIWPFIQPARSGGVDVLIVNDNSADTAENYPDGTGIYNTYTRARQVGLTRMPTIPPVSTFVEQGLNKRATFFGCDEASKITIVYLPNVNYTYPSGQSTFKVQYTVEETNRMIENGVAIGTQNGDPDWPTCLACAVLKKTGSTGPSSRCEACFTKHCYRA